MDAYTHLDITCADPIADMLARMANAGIEKALVVETWKGDNLPWLQEIVTQSSPKFRVVVCFRPDQRQPSPDFLQNNAVVGLRVKTADLSRLREMTTWLAASGKWLIPHAETGIGPLKRQLLSLIERAPGLQVYLPHLGWPRQDKDDDPDWGTAISELQSIPGMVVGVSALAHFSRQPFPHADVQRFATRLAETFGSSSMVAASDYPLIEKGSYGQYMQLAEDWIRSVDVHWAPRFRKVFERAPHPPSP